MTKYLIIKYLEQRASETEERAVLEWVSMSEDNLKYFSTIKNLWIFQNMPNSKAGVSELEEVKKNIQISSGRKRKSKKVIFLRYAAASVIIILLGLNLFRMYEKQEAMVIPKQERELMTNFQKENTSVGSEEGYTKAGEYSNDILTDSLQREDCRLCLSFCPEKFRH